jgi:hypothetical protein
MKKNVKMTSREFVLWLRGFATAANEFTLTPKQWDDLKDQLATVKDADDKEEEVEEHITETPRRNGL